MAELFGKFATQKRDRELQALQARILALPVDLAEDLLDDLADAMENRLCVMDREAARRAAVQA
jgi:hypothetical protein